MRNKIADFLRGKSVLILGFGREGHSSLQFILSNKINCKIGIADQFALEEEKQMFSEHPKIAFHTGPDYLDAVHYYDFILKAPGIPGRNLSQGIMGEISSQTDLFLAAYHHQTIGISGTKGKSTTSSLVHHLLIQSGKKSILTGNIGIPCFDIIPQIEPDSIIVFELSANQLEYVHHSPHICVLLNIFEEHLDHFGTFEAYKEAKKQLLKFCKPKDLIVIHESLNTEINISSRNVLVFPQTDYLPGLQTQLIGSHNLLNVQAAILAVTGTGLKKEEVLKHLLSFKGLPHRIEYLGQFAGIEFYNDSIATIPEATVAAIKSLRKVNFLILGGFDRGIHYEFLTDFLSTNPIENILYTGKAGHRIAMQMKERGFLMQLIEFKTLTDAFDIILKKAKDGDVCLLSPAAASYDQYKNFEHRGDVFKKLVYGINKA